MEPCAQKNSRGPGKSRGSARLPCPGTWAGERRAGGQGWEGQDGSHHCRASKGGKKRTFWGVCKKKRKEKNTLKVHQVLVKQPFLSQDLSQLIYILKSLQTKVELGLRESFAQIFSSRDGQR